MNRSGWPSLKEFFSNDGLGSVFPAVVYDNLDVKIESKLGGRIKEVVEEVSKDAEFALKGIVARIKKKWLGKVAQKPDFGNKLEIETGLDFGLDFHHQFIVIGGGGCAGVDYKIGMLGTDLSTADGFTFPT